MLQCRRDFGEEAGCEDVREVCDLRRLVLARYSMYSLSPARKEQICIQCTVPSASYSKVLQGLSKPFALGSDLAVKIKCSLGASNRRM